MVSFVSTYRKEAEEREYYALGTVNPLLAVYACVHHLLFCGLSDANN
jgi:hypothetical protein